MPNKQNQNDIVERYTWDEEAVSFGDFAAGADNGSQLAQGEIGEIATAEVGDENGVSSALASWDIVRLGQPLGPTGRSALGKLFMAIDDGAGSVVADQAKVRFISRPKNSHNLTPMTRWFSQRDLNESNQDQRVELTPVTDDDGDALYVSDGRVVAIQAKNASAATTFDINGATSDAEVPLLAGW